MNTKTFFIILSLIAVIMWRECIHASRRAHLINHYEQEIALAQDMAADACNDKIADIIQETSDDLLTACEKRIDEIQGQF